MRPSGRAPDQMRAIIMEPGFTRHAEGSCLVSFGDTRVLCTASVESNVPGWLRGKGRGWVTAEYGMLPRATHTRGRREAAAGKQSGRTQEIQRLIGRSLRAVVDLEALGERQVSLDCDVIQADGGTRPAAISGAWVALRLAVDGLLANKLIESDPIRKKVAAVSCGIHNGNAVLDLDYAEDSGAGVEAAIRDSVAAVSVGLVDGEPRLDLCYEEDAGAEVDCNVVMTGSGALVEVQGTAEGAPFDRGQLDELLDLASAGIVELTKVQRDAIDR